MPPTDDKVSAPSTSASAKPSRAKWWISELTSLAIVLAAVTAARSSLADHYYVPSGSMQYTLMDGDRVIVDGFQKFVPGDKVKTKAWIDADASVGSVSDAPATTAAR